MLKIRYRKQFKKDYKGLSSVQDINWSFSRMFLKSWLKNRYCRSNIEIMPCLEIISDSGNAISCRIGC